MKIQTSNLIDLALDWAVAKCEGIDHSSFMRAMVYMKSRTPNPSEDEIEAHHAYEYSTQWGCGGPIIEREQINLNYRDDNVWQAHYNGSWASFGPTPLVAAMRCFVASKLGDEVDVPEEMAA